METNVTTESQPGSQPGRQPKALRASPPLSWPICPTTVPSNLWGPCPLGDGSHDVAAASIDSWRERRAALAYETSCARIWFRETLSLSNVSPLAWGVSWEIGGPHGKYAQMHFRLAAWRRGAGMLVKRCGTYHANIVPWQRPLLLGYKMLGAPSCSICSLVWLLPPAGFGLPPLAATTCRLQADRKALLRAHPHSF
jgi:hypothetical protein